MGRARRSARSRDVAAILRQGGFSLPEMLIVVLVFSIVLTIAGPQVATMVRSWRVESAVNQLGSDLERARSEAIRRNVPITVAFTNSSSYTIQFLGPRALDGATFEAAPDSVRFAAFGPPLTGSATFELVAGEHRRTLLLNGAGFVERP